MRGSRRTGGRRNAARLTGTPALAAALACAAAALALSASGRAAAWGSRALGAAVALVGVAVVSLGSALIRGDWALTYVADYASRDTPWPYRLAGLWAGMAGSLLLWTLVLGLWGVVAAGWCRRRLPELAGTVRAVVAAGMCVLVGLLLWASLPFDRLQIPAIDGGGLTPVLRHPAMLYHPLLLYAGQVGLVVPFALALAARRRGVAAAAWLPGARRWMAVSLVLLAVAMLAGAHWAYVELGWGGYWAWDPVENSALLPWLAGVAFLHLARRPGDGVGAGRAAAAACVLGLGGAFLTRSGSTGSVHAFAEAATVGWVLGAALVAVVVAWAVAGGARGRVRATGVTTPLLSRERALLVSAGVLGGVVVVVGAGTVLPLVRGDGVIVAGRYFARVAWPFALAVLALAGAGPRLRWGGTPARDAVRRMVPAVAAVPGAALAWVGFDRPSVLAVVASALGASAASLTVAELWSRRRRWDARQAGGLVAHLGVAVVLVAVMATATGEHRGGVLGPGQPLRVRGYTLRLEGLAPVDADGPGAAVQATVGVWRGGARVGTVRPRAMLAGTGQRVSVAGLRSTPAEDLRVTLRAVGPAGDGAVVDVTVLPLAQWVWWGGLLVAAGLALTVAGRRRRPREGDEYGHGAGDAAGNPVLVGPVRP